MSAFTDDLRRQVRGEILSDPVSLGLYATDASNYQIFPVAVVVPRDADDVRAAVATAVDHGVSILPRGGGTSLCGQTTGHSLVLDFSKYMNRVVSVDRDSRRVKVQPGITRDKLNEALAPHKLFFAPDPATSSRANLGGMVGNNSAGMRSIIYGKTIDHLLGATVLLAGGDELELAEVTAAEYARRAARPGHEGQIYRRFREIIDHNREEIERRFPKVMRRVGGYALDEFPAGGAWNLSKLFCGSEGTLGVLLELELNVEPIPAATAVCVPHFESLGEAIRAVEPILEECPSAVEILDDVVIRLSRKNRTTARLSRFLEDDAVAALIVEFIGTTEEEANDKASTLAKNLLKRGIVTHCPVMKTKSEQQQVWELRKSGLGIMLGMRGDPKPIPFIEDAAVPIESLPEYVDQVTALCARLDVKLAIYAHASVGVLHIRPILDLRKRDDIEKMKVIADESLRLVIGYGGSWSGEHGDGLSRSHHMKTFYRDQIYRSFVEIKELFDPAWLMNPGKIVSAGPMDANLRYGSGYETADLEEVFRYPEDGRFAAAVEMCTGVGACRKRGSGVMCPSYRVTGDEEHSTRGRANLLRLALAGAFGPEALGSDRVAEAFELCLSCKACKSECPSNVDMAKLKGEFQQQRIDLRGAGAGDRLAAMSADIGARLAGPGAPLINLLQELPPTRFVLEKAAGFDRRRPLPKYARDTFRSWFASRVWGARREGGGSAVALFVDCYMNHHEPDVGRAAVELLERLGYRVILADAGCCQRPRISHGFLRDAAARGDETMRRLTEFVKEDIPVVICEPGCTSALMDDLPDLVPDARQAREVTSALHPIDRFIEGEIDAGRATIPERRDACGPAPRHFLHGHCHQKSLFGAQSAVRLLQLAGAEATLIEAGCCGMAGSFGHEKQHYEISLAIGEDRLFPAVRGAAPDAVVVASGFSCRHQIEHGTGRRAMSWVEAMAGLTRNAGGAPSS